MLVAAGIASIRPRGARVPAFVLVLSFEATRLAWWYAGAPEL
jgi:hypothetical protein